MRLRAQRKNPSSRRLRGWLGLSLWLFVRIISLPTPAYGEIPPAGAVISSQSLATYQENGRELSVVSNEVSLYVTPVHGAVLVPDGTPDAPAAVGRAFSGEISIFPYILSNPGNTEDSYTLEAIPVAPSSFVPASVLVYLDVDGDSLIDPGEGVVTEVDPLGIGESVHLVLAAELPAGLAGGETAHLDLTARSRADSTVFDGGNVVRIIARDEARIALSLVPDVTDVLPGEDVTYTIAFSNVGERGATDVYITDFIDLNGMCVGSDYRAGSVTASIPGTIEFYDGTAGLWQDTEPASGRVKGVRLRLDRLEPGAVGELSFTVTVRPDRSWGDMRNEASSDYTGGDGRAYRAMSGEVIVTVGRVSVLAIGPVGNPTAESGTPEDCVTVLLDGGDTTCTFWHEILNAGNFTDTLEIALADSSIIPSDWEVCFVDTTEALLGSTHGFTARGHVLPRDRTCIVGLRFHAGPVELRRFTGRQLAFMVEVHSLVVPDSRDSVQDVLVKTDVPLISVTQSIREPTALVGDVLSYIVVVENLTGETVIDGIELVENLSAGLGFAGGSDSPLIEGNLLRWSFGRLGPGEKRRVVFRARVKAGQERDRLVSRAWVYGVSEFGEEVSDGPAVASVRIVEGIFTRRGIIFGAVFEDRDGDGMRGADERGVVNVSVFLEGGTYAVTDSAGLYSIPGVVEGTHVVRIDPASLPDTLIAGDTGFYGMGVAGELLIELAPSGNRRADFPLMRSTAEHRGNPFAAIEGSASTVTHHDGSAGMFGGRSGAMPDAGEAADGMGAVPAAEAYEALTIPSTFFAPGSADFEEIPLSQIAALGLWLIEHPGWSIFIAGHTDSVPISTAEFPSNFELSVRRARALCQLCRMNGIPEDRVDYTGYGDHHPVASNGTPEGRARNRRVEITAIPPEGYTDGDPGLPEKLSRPDTMTYSLANDAGICAEIVTPDEGKVYYTRDEIDVDVLTPLGSEVELYVNSLPVGRERIGRKQIDVARGTLGLIFYGVQLRVGRNDILVICHEYGGKRFTCVRHVYLAGQPSGIVPEQETVIVPADGKTPLEIVFLVRDEAGLPVRDGIFVAVEGPPDLVGRLDRNPHQAGIQVPTANGRVVLSLPPGRDSRREQVHVSLGDIRSGCRVAYRAPMRDWFLFGYGEGSVGYSNLAGSGSTHRSIERHRDGLYAEGRIALYGQGEVRNGHMMTCAVDTRPFREDKLFRRIEPEKYYPIYGDAGELRFNTASRSGTYLRLDHRRYNAMLGDFKTDLGTAEFTKYHRSFNGIRGGVLFDRGTVDAFATRTDQVTYQEEIPADGTSGFYFLTHYPLIENSEKIRIEVRDRYRPERILRVDDKQVNRDYDINYMDGSILFKEAVPAMDDYLNPVTIVVSYECANAGEQNFIYGMRASVNVTDSLAVGVTGILEEEGVENSSLVGIDIAGHIQRDVVLESEYAYSEKFLLGGGNAFRVKLGGNHGGAFKWNAYVRDVDKNFFNPSFTGGKTELGSTKYGAEADYRFNPYLSFRTKGYRHRFRERDEVKDYLDVTGSYGTKALNGKLGFAATGHSDTRDGNHDAVLVLAGIGVDRGDTRGALEWDQILAGEEVQEYPNRLQASLSRRLYRSLSAVLKHEYRTGSRTGTRHLTQLGVESNVTEDLHVFSRYRLEGAMSGERGQATIGIKNRFRLSSALTATFSAEKLATVSGYATDDFLSLATGWLYTPAGADHRVKGDYEIRIETERRKHLAGLAALKRMSGHWSVLAKGDLWYSDEKIEMDRVKGSTTIGFSLRPVETGSLTLLALLRGNYEKNSPAHPGAVDKEFMTSFEANYAMNRNWELEGKVAARWVRNAFESYVADASAFLYQAKVIRVIAGAWDVGVTGRVVHQRETRTVRYGGGVEAGRRLANNLWLGVGYDFGGHDDRDAAINDFQRNGFYVKLKLKFNEKIMEYFRGDE
ncbi:MAG TPA: OmpA family protein [Patescibacteria group bacterium]|nr:OmpA family protein [Patescibacteria group bacterium]